MSRCPFSIFDIKSYINRKGIIDNFIPFLIYGRLFGNLYEHIIRKLRVNIELSLNYFSQSVDFHVPDYVIISKDDCYEIFEIE